MKVKDLIKALTNVNPEADVFVWDAGDRLNIVRIDKSFLKTEQGFDEYPSFIDLETDTDTKGETA